MTASDPSSSGSNVENAPKVRRVGRPARAREESHGPVREPQGRAKRVPLGVQRLKLEASKRPGFVRRWVNDDGSRVQQALQGGYEFVRKDGQASTTDIGESISQIVGKTDAGTPMRGYLMEIRDEWFQEDQATKQELINATETQIRRGELVGKVGNEGVYVPSRGISIKRAG